jgi:hypothetical protein
MYQIHLTLSDYSASVGVQASVDESDVALSLKGKQ